MARNLDSCGLEKLLFEKKGCAGQIYNSETITKAQLICTIF